MSSAPWPAPGTGSCPQLHGDPLPMPLPGLSSWRRYSSLQHLFSNSELLRLSRALAGINALGAARAACALGHRSPSSSRPTPWQARLADCVARRLLCYGEPPSDLCPESALTELTSSKDLYSQEPANLAAYDASKLRVCRGETRPKPAVHLLPESSASYLRFFRTCIERPDSECPDKLPVPYCDPVLRKKCRERRVKL